MPAKSNGLRSAFLASTSILVGSGFLSTVLPASSQSILPTNGSVTSGAASIRQSGADLTVTQTSPRAVVNWNSFSIGQGSQVTFNQPAASSAILNRVTGSTTSTLAGSLQANGQVYLVNPNGIAITRTGAVRVGGGFVASTLGIADRDFNSGNLNFVGAGASAGVVNAGSIEAAAGGFVGLIGGTVANSGVVSVPLGKVAMGSGEQATLNLTGDNFLQVAVPTSAKTADGQALIDVSGKVRAAGGSVQLKAATVAKAIRDAVNVPGELSVASARSSGGSIILTGGAGGNVAGTGRLDASGRAKGGAIAISGHNVALRRAKLAVSSSEGRGGSATVSGTNAVTLTAVSVDASGATGGGAIRIGGDFHGASDVPAARTTSIDSASTLNASATQAGDGGTVAVWSDAMTSFAGKIAATGGVSGGDGGYAEVSANPATHGVLDLTGSADLTAPRGATGTLLLDPFNIGISNGADAGGTFSGGVYTPTDTSVINASTLETQLTSANVVVSTGLAGSPGEDAGAITVSAPVSWSSNNGLTLIANSQILINASITSTGAGPLALSAGTSVNVNSPISTVTGALSVTGPTSLSGNVTTHGGPVTFNGAVDFLTASNVTTSGGAIAFNSPVTLQGNTTINAGIGTVAFGGAVDTGFSSSCAAGCDLTVSGSSISFGGALGGINALGTVSLTSTNGMTLPSITATRSVTLNAAGDIVGTTADAITAPALIANSSAGKVVMTAPGNSVPSVSGSGEQGFSFLTSGALDVGSAGITSNAGFISLQTTGGSLTQTGPIRGVALYANAAAIEGTANALLNNPNNSVGTLAGAATGSFQFANSNPAGLTIGPVNYFVSSATGVPDRSTSAGVSSFASSVAGAEIQISTAGNLTLDSPVQGSIPDGLIILAATGNFINNVGPGAVVDPWRIYSASPTGDVFGGLDSGNTAVWNTTFGQPVTAAGNRYLFAFQPTITVTSINDSKTYGQDVTSRVATDFVISGLEPGVPGAFLGDSVAAVYGGAPQVTSLGSPAAAPVTGSPYPITVALGSFTVSDGYALALDSAGRVTVVPLPINYSVLNANSTYGTTATLGAATLSGVLFGDTVVPTVGAFSGATSVAVDPRTPAGVYSEQVTALSNPNYAVAPSGNSPGTLTIGPKAVSYSVANATSLFGTTPILGQVTLFGVLAGDVVFPTAGAFFGVIPIALTPTTPTGQYAELVTAISNPNYRIAPAPNFPGTLTVTALADPGFLPGLTQINNPAPASYGGGEVLPDFTTRCNEPPSMPDPNRFSDPDAALRAISQSMENYFKRCQNPTQTTIADGLEAYAAKLQVLAPRLPPALRNIPSIVAEAARRARAAPSRAAAVAVLRQTVAAIHKEIALVLSEDPATRSRELRDGDVVAGALSGAAVALVNSGGL